MPLPFIKRWATPLSDEPDTGRVEQVWSSSFENIDGVVAMPTDLWAGRLRNWAARSAIGDAISGDDDARERDELVEWFESGQALWDALVTWMIEPGDATKLAALTNKRDKLKKLISGAADEIISSEVVATAEGFRVVRAFVEQREAESKQAHEDAVQLSILPANGMPSDIALSVVRSAWLRWEYLREMLINWDGE